MPIFVKNAMFKEEDNRKPGKILKFNIKELLNPLFLSNRNI